MPMRLMCGTADGWPAGNFVPDSLLSLARSLSGGTRERPRIFSLRARWASRTKNTPRS